MFNKDSFKINIQVTLTVVVRAEPQPTQIRRIPVESKAARSIGYNVISRTLEVEYTSGDVYQYLSVPAWIYDELMDGRSIGRYLNTHVKPFYRVRTVR
jgi:hypothetical protein